MNAQKRKLCLLAMVSLLLTLDVHQFSCNNLPLNVKRRWYTQLRVRCWHLGQLHSAVS